MKSHKKRPCCICRRWFRPDPRVGDRQRACQRPECQTERRRRTQAAWRHRNPEYAVTKRLDSRVEAAEESGRDVEPLRLPAPLRRLPWELAKDEMGAKGADFIGVLGKVILTAGKDEIATQLLDLKEEFRRLPQVVPKDQ